MKTIALLALLCTSALAEVTSPTRIIPPLQSNYGGSGRAVSVRDRGAGIDVRWWYAPGLQAPRSYIAMFPVSTVLEWWTQGGNLYLRHVGAIGASVFPLHLYGITEDDAILVTIEAPGAGVTVYGLPGMVLDAVALPIGSLCRGTIVLDGVNSWPEQVRFRAVKIYN